VCDRCNNGTLAVADEALVNFPPITLLRGERGIPTTAGKAVASKWGNATIYWGPERGTLNVVGGKKAVRRMTTDGKTSKGTVNLTTGGPITKARISRMVRSIWKSTLEFVYLHHVADVAFDPGFDELRSAVLTEGSSGWALLGRTGTPTDTVKLTYEPAHHRRSASLAYRNERLRRDLYHRSADAGLRPGRPRILRAGQRLEVLAGLHDHDDP
jgi:hypothetical protein